MTGALEAHLLAEERKARFVSAMERVVRDCREGLDALALRWIEQMEEETMDEQEVLARFDSVEEITEEQADAIQTVRLGFKTTAALVLDLCPSTRSRNIALTKLEDASHYAIKAITHGA